ncbi:hypothetical protein SNEBB_000580 [Seison nebaliae]|nr:hypothetical protein SNEBB_000580 [Seison nebaliae]
MLALNSRSLDELTEDDLEEELSHQKGKTAKDIKIFYGNNNRLKSVQHILFRSFVNLIKIDLSSNDLVDLPSSIIHVTQLNELILKHNHLNGQSLTFPFDQLKNLTILNLSGNEFDEIPPAIFKLGKLINLYFSDNRLLTISEDVSLLKNLQILFVGGNRLTSLPHTISQLTQLTGLMLCSNRLTSVPSTLCDLKNLKTLMLHDNLLRTIPTDIVKLEISELSLRDNPLIDEFVHQLKYDVPSLQELSARIIHKSNLDFEKILPRHLSKYLKKAQKCVNPKCEGVYFTSCVQNVKFVDFCGKYHLPLMMYLCSSSCSTKAASQSSKCFIRELQREKRIRKRNKSSYRSSYRSSYESITDSITSSLKDEYTNSPIQRLTNLPRPSAFLNVMEPLNRDDIEEDNNNSNNTNVENEYGGNRRRRSYSLMSLRNYTQRLNGRIDSLFIENSSIEGDDIDHIKMKRVLLG